MEKIVPAKSKCPDSAVLHASRTEREFEVLGMIVISVSSFSLAMSPGKARARLGNLVTGMTSRL